MDKIIRFPSIEETPYIKIKASYKQAKDRLNRTILVRPDIDLVELGCILCTVFGAELAHPFLFRCKDEQFVPGMLFDEFALADDEFLLEESDLDDLDDTFTFLYNFGDEWSFACRKYKRETILRDTRKVIVVDGKGQGLWEDNRYGFDAYLSGMVDPESDEPDESLGVSLPWNLSLTKYSDFDLPLDISALQMLLDASIDDIISECRENMFPSEDDESPKEAAALLFELISNAVMDQVDTVPHVNQAFQRLKRRYDENTAYGMIAEALTDEVYAVLTQNRPYSTELYRQHLKQLK